MPASLVNTGVKQEINAGYLDLLWKSVGEEKKVLTGTATKHMQETISNIHETTFRHLKLNVKSQEMFKVGIQHVTFSNKSDQYEKSKIKKKHAIKQDS